MKSSLNIGLVTKHTLEFLQKHSFKEMGVWGNLGYNISIDEYFTSKRKAIKFLQEFTGEDTSMLYAVDAIQYLFNRNTNFYSEEELKDGKLNPRDIMVIQQFAQMNFQDPVAVANKLLGLGSFVFLSERMYEMKLNPEDEPTQKEYVELVTKVRNKIKEAKEKNLLEYPIITFKEHKENR